MPTDKTRRTEILIETHEVSVIRLAGKSQTLVCRTCGGLVYAFTAEQAAQVLNLSSSELEKLKQDRSIHSVDEATPHLFCGVSIGTSSSSIERQKHQQEIRNDESSISQQS